MRRGFGFAFGRLPLPAAVIAAAAPLLGMNPNLNDVTYFSGAHPFIDRAKTANNGAGRGAPVMSAIWNIGGSAATAADLNALGFPAIVGQTYITNVGVDDPAGPVPHRYVILHSGEYTINPVGTNIDASVPGRIEFDANPQTSGVGTTTQQQISVTVKSAPTSGSYLKVVRLDQEALLAAGQIINPEFLRLFTKFGMIRFMDWLGTNGNPRSTFASRPLPEQLSWSTEVPLEACIALANAIGSDGWFNVPHLYDNASAAAMVQFVLPKLIGKLYLEWSNETWNGAFAAQPYATAQEETAEFKALFPNNTVPYGYGFTWGGYRAAQVAQVAAEAAGSQRSRLRNIIAFQTVIEETMLEAREAGITAAGYAHASDVFDCGAIAGYFGVISAATPEALAAVLGFANNGAAGVTAAFDQMNNGGIGGDADEFTIPGNFAKFDFWCSALRARNLEPIVYEGGSSFEVAGYFDQVGNPYTDADRANVQVLYDTMHADPRMVLGINSVLDGWFTRGGGRFNVFVDFSEIRWEIWKDNHTPTVQSDAYDAYVPPAAPPLTPVISAPINPVVGSSMPTTITATGGRFPITVEIDDALPSGRSFDGRFQIDGAYDTVGPVTYHGRIIDAVGTVAEFSQTVNVGAAPEGFQYFRLESFANYQESNFLAFGEVELLDQDGTPLSLAGATASFVAGSAAGYDGPAAHGIDGDIATYTGSTNANPSNYYLIALAAGQKLKPASIRLTPRQDNGLNIWMPTIYDWYATNDPADASTAAAGTRVFQQTAAVGDASHIPATLDAALSYPA